MRRRVWVIAGVTVVTVLGLGAATPLLLPGMLLEQQPISAATSSDGSWSVAVVGHPTLSGSYELVAEVRDSRGQVIPGGIVVDLTRDLAAAKGRYTVEFPDNVTARVGSHTLHKATFLPE